MNNIVVPTDANINKFNDSRHNVLGAFYAMSSQTLYVKFQSQSSGSDYWSRFIVMADVVYAEHDCQGIRMTGSCWHLAAVKALICSVPENTAQIKGFAIGKKQNLPETDLVAIFTDPEDPPFVYKDGLWKLLETQVPLVAKPEPEPAPEPDMPVHPDDAWLSSLKLPVRLYRALMEFRSRQRERLLLQPELIHLIPNLGMGSPDEALQSSLAFACIAPPKHLLNYVVTGADVAWALAPMLYPGDWEPLLVSGPAGTGKTMLAHYMAAALMLPLAIYCGNAQTNIESMLGEKEIVHEDGQMKICHAPGIVLTAIQSGMMLCFNEINHVLPEISSFLNDILDFQKSTYIHGIGRVDVSPDFRFVATRNKGYFGTSEINQALLDRCVQIDLPYPDSETVEKIISTAVPGVDPAIAAKLAKLFSNLVHAAKADTGTLGPEHVSLRSLLRVAKDSQIFGEDKNAVLRSIISGVNDPSAEEALRQLVNSLFTGSS